MFGKTLAKEQYLPFCSKKARPSGELPNAVRLRGFIGIQHYYPNAKPPAASRCLLAKTANFRQIFQKKLQNPLDKGQGFWYTPSVKQKNFTTQQVQTAEHRGSTAMAKDLEMGYLLDFYGEVLTQKQREMLRQYYNDDLSLSEIGAAF